MRKKTFSFLGLTLAAALLFFSGCSGGEKKPVATVGESVITQAEFREALKRLVPQDQSTGKDDLTAIKKDLINQLVEEKLLLSQAAKYGVNVSDEELAAEVDAIKNEYGEASFKDAIAEKYGSLDKWKNDIKNKLIIKKTVERLVAEQPPVTEKEARDYYNEHPEEFSTTERVHARMIVVASEEEALKIRKGLTVANFAETAKKVSLSPDKENGGDLGYFARGEMPAAFEDAVFKLNTGQISPVVKTEYGFHIFLVEGKKKGGKFSFSEVKDRIMERLKAEQEDSVFRDWMAALKQKTKIEVREELL